MTSKHICEPANAAAHLAPPSRDLSVCQNRNVTAVTCRASLDIALRGVQGRLGDFVTLMRNRSASFTASAFRNIAATSGSKRITPPKLFRRGPNCHTPNLIYTAQRTPANTAISVV